MPARRSLLVSARAAVLGGILAIPTVTPARADTPSVPHPFAYGVIVGNNAGRPGQAALRYAEDDAARVASVLRDLGRFGQTDLRVLAHPSAADVVRTIDEVGDKIRAHAQRGEQAVLIFYYSGHA